MDQEKYERIKLAKYADLKNFQRYAAGEGSLYGLQAKKEVKPGIGNLIDEMSRMSQNNVQR